MFSAPASISVGDDYDKRLPVPDRVKGAQFKTSAPKKGNTPDVFFDNKFKSLSEGDKYVDPGMADKKERLSSSQKKITPEGFRYPSPGKRGCGLGSDAGCFGTYKHETEWAAIKKGEPPKKVVPVPRNITTQPGKKGTYGYPGTTLGGRPEYISDSYNADKRSDSGKEKKLLGGPFKAACRRVDFFDSQPNVSASKCYSLDRPLPAKKPESQKAEPPITIPFKPSSPPKKGIWGTLGKLPEYKENPETILKKMQHEENLKNKAAVKWVPVSGSKTLPTRSIAFSATATV